MWHFLLHWQPIKNTLISFLCVWLNHLMCLYRRHLRLRLVSVTLSVCSYFYTSTRWFPAAGRYNTNNQITTAVNRREAEHTASIVGRWPSYMFKDKAALHMCSATAVHWESDLNMQTHENILCVCVCVHPAHCPAWYPVASLPSAGQVSVKQKHCSDGEKQCCTWWSSLCRSWIFIIDTYTHTQAISHNIITHTHI